MTPQEHNLIFTMFALQEVKIRALSDALANAGAISDLAQFEEFARKDKAKRDSIVAELRRTYEGVGANYKLDIHVDISQ
jgi:hypothetical protein